MNRTMFATKEYLAQAYHIDWRINCKLEQVMALRDLAVRATPILSDMPRADSGNKQPMAAIVSKMVDLENEVNKDIDALIDLKRELMGVIRLISNAELQMLLELRYLCFKSWEQVAETMHYDARYVYKLHGKALAAVERVLPAEALNHPRMAEA